MLVGRFESINDENVERYLPYGNVLSVDLIVTFMKEVISRSSNHNNHNVTNNFTDNSSSSSSPTSSSSPVTNHSPPHSPTTNNRPVQRPRIENSDRDGEDVMDINDEQPQNAL